MCPIFVGSVHNFDRSRDVMILWKILISTRCIHGFMSNLIKKSWTDSKVHSISCENWRHDISHYTKEFCTSLGQPSLNFKVWCYLYQFVKIFTFVTLWVATSYQSRRNRGTGGMQSPPPTSVWQIKNLYKPGDRLCPTHY